MDARGKRRASAAMTTEVIRLDADRADDLAPLVALAALARPRRGRERGPPQRLLPSAESATGNDHGRFLQMALQATM